jgi:glycosyltransferase involved in cell wall biosynthesis
LKVNWIEREVTLAELAEHYTGATLYVSAASHEGFGLPACEAILAGTPAIYLECGGTESILDGQGMVLNREKDSIWCHIVDLLRRPDRYTALLAAQERIVNEFTPDGVSGAIKNVYCRWLNNLAK